MNNRQGKIYKREAIALRDWFKINKNMKPIKTTIVVNEQIEQLKYILTIIVFFSVITSDLFQ